MPNIQSAKKRLRVTHAKTLRNKMIKSNLKTVEKAAAAAVAQGAEDKAEKVRVAIQKVDQAASKGIFHKNKSARKKAQLQKMLNAAK